MESIDKTQNMLQQLAASEAIIKASENMSEVISLIQNYSDDILIEKISDLLHCTEEITLVVMNSGLIRFSPSKMDKIKNEVILIRNSLGTTQP